MRKKVISTQCTAHNRGIEWNACLRRDAEEMFSLSCDRLRCGIFERSFFHAVHSHQSVSQPVCKRAPSSGFAILLFCPIRLSLLLACFVLCCFSEHWNIRKQKMLCYHELQLNTFCSVHMCVGMRTTQNSDTIILHIFMRFYVHYGEKRSKNFCQYFSQSAKKKHYAIWCEFSAPGFISPYTLYNKYIIIKFVVCNSLLLYLYLCDGHCVFAFVYLFGPIFCLCYYSYLAIVGTDVRIYIPLRWMQWDRFTAVDL